MVRKTPSRNRQPRHCPRLAVFSAYSSRSNGASQSPQITWTSRVARIEARRLERTAKRAKMQSFLKMLVKHGDLITEFDEELWYINDTDMV